MSNRIKRKMSDTGPAGMRVVMLEKMKDEIELVCRHLEVARAVADHEPIGIMKLSELLDLPAHRIRYSLHVLEQLGYIRASPDGAVVTARTVELFSHLNDDLDELVRLLEGMKRGA
jgi:predicted transcriptional regulator